MNIDYSKDQLLTEFAKATLRDRYMIPGETSPQDAFARAAKAFADDDAHAQRLYDYVSNLWFMFSTPILSNGGTQRGLGISCYLSSVGDSRKAITQHWEENMFLASMGGGIGAYYGNLRSNGIPTSKGSKSNGIIPFLKVADAEIQAVSQGETRRGSLAAYLPIDHPEVEEFIQIRKPTGGDENRKALNIHNGIVIPDAFMKAAEAGKDWDLIDPVAGKVKTVKARDLWQSIIETRLTTGEPYCLFKDTVNNNLPEAHKTLGLTVETSNLCNEVVLHTSEERTAVCCLSSVNLENYYQWKDNPLFIEDIIRMLDNVLDHFIQNAPPELWRAINSAKLERSLGMGAMGFHSLLQSQGVPFEGVIAKGLNRTIFKHIRELADKATRKLAVEKGKAPDSLQKDPVRNIYVMSVAPNASTSILANTSPSIEPIVNNAFTHKTLSGSFLVKNKHLEFLLKEKGKDTEDTWQSIILREGSVQHLDFLDSWEKDVFKTAYELDQNWIIEHASVRQKFIDQSQSLNLFFSPEANIKDIHDVHWNAWKKGCKGLYYLRSKPLREADKISEKVERITREEGGCLGCEG